MEIETLDKPVMSPKATNIDKIIISIMRLYATAIRDSFDAIIFKSYFNFFSNPYKLKLKLIEKVTEVFKKFKFSDNSHDNERKLSALYNEMKKIYKKILNKIGNNSGKIYANSLKISEDVLFQNSIYDKICENLKKYATELRLLYSDMNEIHDEIYLKYDNIYNKNKEKIILKNILTDLDKINIVDAKIEKTINEIVKISKYFKICKGTTEESRTKIENDFKSACFSFKFETMDYMIEKDSRREIEKIKEYILTKNIKNMFDDEIIKFIQFIETKKNELKNKYEKYNGRLQKKLKDVIDNWQKEGIISSNVINQVFSNTLTLEIFDRETGLNRNTDNKTALCYKYYEVAIVFLRSLLTYYIDGSSEELFLNLDKFVLILDDFDRNKNKCKDALQSP